MEQNEQPKKLAYKNYIDGTREVLEQSKTEAGPYRAIV